MRQPDEDYIPPIGELLGMSQEPDYTDGRDDMRNEILVYLETLRPVGTLPAVISEDVLESLISVILSL